MESQEFFKIFSVSIFKLSIQLKKFCVIWDLYTKIYKNIRKYMFQPLGAVHPHSPFPRPTLPPPPSYPSPLSTPPSNHHTSLASKREPGVRLDPNPLPSRSDAAFDPPPSFCHLPGCVWNHPSTHRPSSSSLYPPHLPLHFPPTPPPPSQPRTSSRGLS